MGEYDHIFFNTGFTVPDEFRMLQGAILRRLEFKHGIRISNNTDSGLFYDEKIQTTWEYIFAIDNISLMLKSLNEYKCSFIKKDEQICYKYHVYNLHHKEKKDWLKITKEFISGNYTEPDKENDSEAGQNKDRYIFIWFSNKSTPQESRDVFKEKDSCEPIFCYSKLLRDILIKKGMGIEVDLSLGICNAKTGQSVENFFETELIAALNTFDDTKKIFPEFNFLEKIVTNFSDYFPNNKNTLTKVQLEDFFLDFYALGLNSTAFTSANDTDKIIGGITKGEIKVGHDLPGSVLKSIQENESNDKIATIAKWRSKVEFVSQLTKLLVNYTNISTPPKIFLIDDREENMKLQIHILEQWLGYDNNKIKKAKELTPEVIKNNKKYDFLIIDLDYEGRQTGYEYLRRLREEKNNQHIPPFVIVLSRYESPAAIQKSFDMGAMIYATKQNIGQLVLEIHKVLPLLYKYKKKNSLSEKSKPAIYASGFHNWSLLEKLPFNKILELRNDTIQGTTFIEFAKIQESKKNCKNKASSWTRSGSEFPKIQYHPEYRWIKKLPKAELHCHIGSLLGVRVISKTSLLVLSKLYNSNNTKKSFDAERIKSIINFIEPIVMDPFLDENTSNLNDDKLNTLMESAEQKEWYMLKNALIIDPMEQKYTQSIFDIISSSLNLKANNRIPEEVLLNPDDDTFEKFFHPLSKILSTKYFTNKRKLQQKSVTYDEVMLFFILFLNLREFLKKKMTDRELKNTINNYLKSVQEPFPRREKYRIPKGLWDSKEIKQNLMNFKRLLDKAGIDVLITDLASLKNESQAQVENEKSLLSFLMSANSEERCLKFEGRGLFHYLRGCEYGGSPHLQTPESIFLAAHHIVNEYAIPQNIRYLDLRCAVDSYNKFQLFKGIEPMDALFQSFDHWTKIANNTNTPGTKKKTINQIHVNIIITAKRHKSLKEFEDNIKLVQKYGIEKLLTKRRQGKNTELSYFESETELVSFDIAGLEKNNRVSKFREQLQPLLKSCFPITVHAGEEDSHEAIWEAVYIAHSQRLGHALTLSENPSLLNLVRERGINIEMCPISNYLTNKKFKFKEQTYPLKKYMKESLSVSINTDNPNASDSDLSMEYLFAARLSGGISKWDILKLILNGFKSITINKTQKRKLIHEINEEIFDILLNEGR